MGPVLATSLRSVYLGFAANARGGRGAAVHRHAVDLGLCRDDHAAGPRSLMIAIFGVGLYLSLLAKGPVGPAVVITSGRGVLADPSRSRQRIPFGQASHLPAFRCWRSPPFGLGHPADRASGGRPESRVLEPTIIGRALAPHGRDMRQRSRRLSSDTASLPALPAAEGFFPGLSICRRRCAASGPAPSASAAHACCFWSWGCQPSSCSRWPATKLPHYVFPLYPALGHRLVAAFIGTRRQHQPLPGLAQGHGGWLYLARPGFATAAAILGSALPASLEAPGPMPVALAFRSGHIWRWSVAVAGARRIGGKGGDTPASFLMRRPRPAGLCRPVLARHQARRTRRSKLADPMAQAVAEAGRRRGGNLIPRPLWRAELLFFIGRSSPRSTGFPDGSRNRRHGGRRRHSPMKARSLLGGDRAKSSRARPGHGRRARPFEAGRRIRRPQHQPRRAVSGQCWSLPPRPADS